MCDTFVKRGILGVLHMQCKKPVIHIVMFHTCNTCALPIHVLHVELQI